VLLLHLTEYCPHGIIYLPNLYKKGDKKMRKLTAIILSLVFVLSTLACLAVPVSAADTKVEVGQVAEGYKPADGAIKVEKLEDITDLAGNYYLAKDLKIDQTVTAEFTGTIDGCGHTITVSVPVFEALSGNIKNLTIKGAVSTDTGHIGALAKTIDKGPVTISNVANEATVTSTYAPDNASKPTNYGVGGIVGRIKNDKATNVVFDNCVNRAKVVGAKSRAGGIVGEAHRAPETGTETKTRVEFKNCVNYGEISSALDYYKTLTAKENNESAAGGILGYNGTGFVKATNCTNNGEIKAAFRAGGIVGDARKGAVVTNCKNNAAVTVIVPDEYTAGGNIAAGGAVGYTGDGSTLEKTVGFSGIVNNGRIAVEAGARQIGVAGSVIGYITNTKRDADVFNVKSCINNAEIKAGNQAGGFVGYAFATPTRYVAIESCVNLGKIITAKWGSQFIAYTNSNSTTIKNSIGAGATEIIETKNAEGVVNDTYILICGVSNADNVKGMKIENVILWDNGATEWYTWAESDDNAANRIKLEDAMKADFSETVSITRIALDGEGTATKPYLIKTAEDLKNLAKLVNTGYNFEGKYITQTADIDLKNEEWTAIGTAATPFCGVYDGKTFKITNLSVTKRVKYAGLFGCVKPTDNSDAGLANINVSGKIAFEGAADWDCIGGLVAMFNQEQDKACKLYAINCTVNVDIDVKASGQPRIGGAFGCAFMANVDNVVNNGNLKVVAAKCSRVGGITGQTNSVTYKNCVNNGNVEVTTAGETTYAAGIAAVITYRANQNTVFDNCVNNGKITGITTDKCVQVFVGGIAGGIYSAASPKVLNLTIKNCVNNGELYGETGEGKSAYAYVGGMMPYDNIANTVIENCVNTVDPVTGMKSVGGNGGRAGGIVGVIYKGDNIIVKNSTTVGKVAGWNQNSEKTNIVETKEVEADKAEEVAKVVEAGKALSDAIKPSEIKIAGMPTNEMTPPAPPTPTPTPTATGDNTVIMIAAFALAMVAGLALVFVPKKKEN